MPKIQEVIPDIGILVALAPEQLGRVLLSLAAGHVQNRMFNPAAISGGEALYGHGIPGRPLYPRGREWEISIALGEAWQWLEINSLIMPADDINGSNGWKVFTRRGVKLVDDESAFRAFISASQFPRAMLHPSLGDDVWLELAQGKLADAVFKSFRAVEEAVRSVGGYVNDDYGVALMRRAFNPKNGPLTRLGDTYAEREGLMHLFEGAVLSYKNPHSHRTVSIEDIQDAQDMVVLASHLLRIVDSRRAT